MFCPECHAEYRPGFYRCADCDMDLVDALPPEAAQAASSSQFDHPRTIWKGDSESDCVEQCEDLKAAGIPYEVRQVVKERQAKMGVKWRYEVAVSGEDAQRARGLLQLPEKVVEWDSDAPEPEPDESEALPESRAILGSDVDEARRRRNYLKSLDPEDATVEVWHLAASGYNKVEAGLQENYVRVHTQPQPDGSRKLFVLPEDEAVAREIIREIAEGSVPS